MELSKKKVTKEIYSKNAIKIINIARFTDQKDHLTLLKAFVVAKKKVNCELVLLGYGANEIKIREFINKNKISSCVKILKFDFNPYKYLAKADLYILTSLYEGLPNVLLEALTLKKIIISTNCPTGPAEILVNGKYGVLFKMHDYRTLSKIIINYSKNKKAYKNKSNLGHKSLTRFDYQKNCKKYLDLILKYS